MRFSVKLDYGCRALARMAARYASGELSRIEELAKVEEIPTNYLAQILGELRNGGLIESRRGKAGGYALARPPGEITLREAIALLQGDLFGSVGQLQGASGPGVARAFAGLRAAFEEKAEALTLRDMAAAPGEEMYYI